MKGRKVFVTGATGFIGRRLVAALAGGGAQVTVLSRSRSQLQGGPRQVTGGMTDAALMAKSFAGQDVIFNLAYDVRASGADNLAGFRTMLKAAEDCGAGRIVHTSSIVVYDGWPDGNLSESSPMTRPGGSPYRRAKIEMERLLIAGRTPAAVLQPTIVYGAGSSLWTDHLAQALASGGVVLPDPEGVCNGVHVDDVVQALILAAGLPGLGQERFIVSGPAPFRWSALLDGYAGIMGKGTLLREPAEALRARLGARPDESGGDHGPSALARISAIGRRLIGRDRFESLVRTARRRLRPAGPMHPDHHLLELFLATGSCDIAHARTRLGYAPSHDLAKGLAATADHLRSLASAL